MCAVKGQIGFRGGKHFPCWGIRRGIMGEIIFDILEGCFNFEGDRYGIIAKRMLQIKSTA